MAIKYMHFVDENGNALTSQTHGVVKLVMSDGSKQLPADTDAGNADGAELVYSFDPNLKSPAGLEGNTQPLTLANLVEKATADDDETGQAFS